jgi:hypothetical protein
MTLKTSSTSMTRGRRMHAGVRFSCLAASCMALLACTGGRADDVSPSPPSSSANASSASPSSPAYVDDAWGFRIDTPTGWTLRHDFQHGYLTNGAWKTFAAPGSQGQPVLSLVMPGSNQVTDAEIRIGASRDPAEVQQCAEPPSAVVAGSVATQRIDGIAFTTFQARDAAMSHHLDVHAWRVVHGGACYAIDLLVYGVNPQVYDPPATPPFSDADAFEAMRAVLGSFAFEGPADQPAASASTAAR